MTIMVTSHFSSIIFYKIVSLLKIGQKKCPFFKTQFTFWKFFVESKNQDYLLYFVNHLFVLFLFFNNLTNVMLHLI
jgi:hypothetical protein